MWLANLRSSQFLNFYFVFAREILFIFLNVIELYRLEKYVKNVLVLFSVQIYEDKSSLILVTTDSEIWWERKKSAPTHFR